MFCKFLIDLYRIKEFLFLYYSKNSIFTIILMFTFSNAFKLNSTYRLLLLPKF